MVLCIGLALASIPPASSPRWPLPTLALIPSPECLWPAVGHGLNTSSPWARWLSASQGLQSPETGALALRSPAPAMQQVLHNDVLV